jgi:hypothetical protein
MSDDGDWTVVGNKGRTVSLGSQQRKIAAAAARTRAACADQEANATNQCDGRQPNHPHRGQCKACTEASTKKPKETQYHTLPRTDEAKHEAERFHAEILALYRNNQGPIKQPLNGNGAKGKMLGVLICVNETGETVVLKTVSGLGKFENHSPPIPFSEDDNENQKKLEELQDRRNKLNNKIKNNQNVIESEKLLTKNNSEIDKLRAKINNNRQLKDFNGKIKSQFEACINKSDASDPRTGNCAAPKLIADAQNKKLTPVGLAEIWIGEGFYEDKTPVDSCNSCKSILGFMLCGLHQKQVTLEKKLESKMQ